VIRACFIGINKYSDPRIRDLSGARRDALALWSLFCDTIPDIEAQLLTDAEARVDSIRLALDQTLGAANEDDIVIVSFAGHGTHDHRIVAHDTLLDALPDSTISMSELASRFKNSSAKVVLFILDCCFSGGAPARVLEDSPATRDMGDPLETLAGKGRILIAAANINEVAYELTGSGHGILTKALLDTLQAGEGSINVTEAMSQVMER
jgi:helicase